MSNNLKSSVAANALIASGDRDDTVDVGKTLAEKIVPPIIVAERLNISRVTLWRMVRSKEFPPPIKISANRTGWPESDVAAFIERRIAERDAGQASK